MSAPPQTDDNWFLAWGDSVTGERRKHLGCFLAERILLPYGMLLAGHIRAWPRLWKYVIYGVIIVLGLCALADVSHALPSQEQAEAATKTPLAALFRWLTHFRLLWGVYAFGIPLNIFLFPFLAMTSAIGSRAKEVDTSIRDYGIADSTAITQHGTLLAKTVETHDARVVAAIGAYGNIVEKFLEGLLGHKVWAEPRTHELLEQIVAKEAGGKAKWHIVKFLANLADDCISGGTRQGGFRLTTESRGVWHVARYSRFLSANIEHAEREIVWLVDPRDFCDVLLPECARYVLASIVYAKLDCIKGDLWGRSSNYADVFDPLFAKITNTAVRDAIAGKLKTLCGDKGGAIDLSDESETAKWESFHRKILPGILLFAPAAIRADEAFDQDMIRQGFKILYEDWIVKTLPHIAALQRCMHASRLVLVPRCKSSTSTNTLITEECAVATLAGRLRDTLEADDSLKATGVPLERIVPSALDLFETLSGGRGRMRACVTTTEGELAIDDTLDVGLYDDHFLVWSRRPGSETVASRDRGASSMRVVTWYYIEDMKLARSGSLLGETAQRGYDILKGQGVEDLKHADEETSYDVFRRMVLSALSSSAPAEPEACI